MLLDSEPKDAYERLRPLLTTLRTVPIEVEEIMGHKKVWHGEERGIHDSCNPTKNYHTSLRTAKNLFYAP